MSAETAPGSSHESILLVEDERNVGSTLVERLIKESFDVVWAQSLAEAHAATQSRRFSLALLDVGLPDGSGFDLAARIRETEPGTAIIFLTAFGNPEDRVRGLELGAEDYIVKPFHLKELLLRVRNGLRRAQSLREAQAAEPRDGVEIGRARVRFSRFEATNESGTHPLTHKECALLKLLVDRRGEVVSRDQILEEIWAEGEFPTTRTVDNFILKLRKIVETNADAPQVIRSIRGIGYQLV
jgi:two-component system alkaline phosphatase synthesis response regulator PhoP